MGLKETCERWDKNQSVIGFEAKLVIDKDGLSVNIANSPRKYLKAIKELSDVLLKEGLAFIAETFAFPISHKNSDATNKEIKEFIVSRTNEYLRILFCDGYKAFTQTVLRDATVLQFRYEMESLRFDGTNWIRWDESILTEAGWIQGTELCRDELWQVISDRVTEHVNCPAEASG